MAICTLNRNHSRWFISGCNCTLFSTTNSKRILFRFHVDPYLHGVTATWSDLCKLDVECNWFSINGMGNYISDEVFVIVIASIPTSGDIPGYNIEFLVVICGSVLLIVRKTMKKKFDWHLSLILAIQ